MKDYRMTDTEAAFIDTFGFIKFEGLLADRVGRIIEDFENVWSERGGDQYGKPHDGTIRSCIVPFIDQSEGLSSLLDDPHVNGICKSLCGDQYQFIGTDGNYYVGDTRWHSDGGWPRPVVFYKMAFYLDSLTLDTGAIRVIPGSHKYGDAYAESLEELVGNSEDAWGIHGSEVPAYAISSEPGDVIVFHQGTKHSSWGGSDHRRMFTMNFCRRYRDNEIHHLRKEVGNFSHYLLESVYGEKMLKTAGPERMRHLEQALAHQDHLPDLVREVRESRNEVK